MRTGILIALGIVIGSTLSAMIAVAWTAPSANPPGANVSSPVNVGNVTQIKNGTLGVNDLGVFGNTLLNGVNGDGTGNGVNTYLNFGATTGQNGYGVRDNAGILEFKNNGGSWATIQSTVFTLMGGGATWAVSSNGTDIYNANSGNVGIGTASPAGILDVRGGTAASGNGTNINIYAQNGASGYANGGNIILMPGVSSDGGSYGYSVGGSVAIGTTGTGIIYGVNGTMVYPQTTIGRDSNMSAPLLSLMNTSAYSAGTNQEAEILFGGTDFEGIPQSTVAILGVSNFTAYGANTGYLSFRTKQNGLNIDAPASEQMRITSAGNVGIGTTSPDMLLTVGSNAPSGPVAHFENSSGSCYINPTTTSLSCSSDSRLKTNVVPLESAQGLATVLKLNPVTYNWKTESATTSPHTGFIAQDVRPVLPDLISQGPDGFYTMNYAGLTPYLVKAVQEIATLSDTFKTTLIAWLANAQNGITDFFAQTIHTQKLCTTRSDGTQVCVTNDQLAGLLSQAGASSLPTSVTSSSGGQVTNSETAGNGNSTPPVISINGANPATISTGTTYADLGATITAPKADLNLGITLVVDNATSTDGTVQIDTSRPGTHTILYTVTDPSGLTGTITRTVIVSPVQQTPPPANDNTTSPPAANDNSGSGTATGTNGQ